MLSFGKRGDFFRCGAGIRIRALWAGPGSHGRGLNGNQGYMGVACSITARSGRGLVTWVGSSVESRRYGRGLDWKQCCVGVVKTVIKAAWAWPATHGRGQEWNQGGMGGAWAGIREMWAGPGPKQPAVWAWPDLDSSPVGGAFTGVWAVPEKMGAVHLDGAMFPGPRAGWAGPGLEPGFLARGPELF